ncbi:hypothetical protein SPONL_1122 [uncultured Candidatus Thioglobus sp.]|nr:hypothetical protein SPONL_1122 [uncultured Candidatus Thioglobus sp.]
MGIIKVIIVALLVWAGFVLLKKFRKTPNTVTHSSNNTMLACSVCGIHIPENEAIISKTKVYCSEQHLKQGVSE